MAGLSARGNRFTAQDTEDYQVVLPQFPTGQSVLNTIFFHADMRARPYRVEDFRDTLTRLALLPDVLPLGAYQMNPVWAVTFKSADGVKKILAMNDVKVKDRRCIIINPTNQEGRLKLHWLLYNVPDDAVRAALAPYGRVGEVRKERWRVDGIQDKGSTLRSVTLKLKAGVSIDDLPHELRVAVTKPSSSSQEEPRSVYAATLRGTSGVTVRCRSVLRVVASGMTRAHASSRTLASPVQRGMMTSANTSWTRQTRRRRQQESSTRRRRSR